MRIFHDKSGQGMVTEYAITFFIAIGFVSMMTVYVRRAVQARIHGAEHYAMAEVNGLFSSGQNNLVGRFSGQYEPYYAISQAMREQNSEITERMLPAGNIIGIYEKTIVKDRTAVTGTSVQLPPVNAD